MIINREFASNVYENCYYNMYSHVLSVKNDTSYLIYNTLYSTSDQFDFGKKNDERMRELL